MVDALECEKCQKSKGVGIEDYRKIKGVGDAGSCKIEGVGEGTLRWLRGQKLL